MKTLMSVTAALVSVASGVDKAIGASSKAKNEWAQFCAMRLVGDKPSITIDDVGEALVTQCKLVATKKIAAQLATPGSLSTNGFSTAYGWFADLKRVQAAGLLPMLLEKGKDGKFLHTLTTVRRSTAPTNGNKSAGKSKRSGKGNQKVAPEAAPTPPVAAPSANITFKDVARFLVDARKANDIKAIASNEAQLSVIIAESGNLARRLATYRKAQAKRKAIGSPQATVAKVKASMKKAA